MGRVFALALTAALNPSLLAAVTLMLTLSRPKRLLLGYLLGAALTSLACGFVLVFAIPHSSTSSTSQHTVSPAIDITLGALVLLVVFVVATGRDRRRQAWSQRRRERAEGKPPPRWMGMLSKGSARDTFVIGVLLSFPGASYIVGMDTLSRQKIGTGAVVAIVFAFNAIQLALLEAPLVGYTFAPDWTEDAVRRFSGLLRRRGGQIGVIVATVIGGLLILRGLLNL
ncbi:MAG: GAP family protein [Solirubrobacterales bacterium]|nr:GAP family protein [Solirubrobacterales bacterium]